MNLSDIKPYFRKRDIIRWSLGAGLIFFVFKETGFATLIFATLVLLESELQSFINRMNIERDIELLKFLKGITDK